MKKVTNMRDRFKNLMVINIKNKKRSSNMKSEIMSLGDY